MGEAHSPQFCTIYCEINKNYGLFLIILALCYTRNIAVVSESKRVREETENMATNKYKAIIIIFIRGFG